MRCQKLPCDSGDSNRSPCRSREENRQLFPAGKRTYTIVKFRSLVIPRARGARARPRRRARRAGLPLGCPASCLGAPGVRCARRGGVFLGFGVSSVPPPGLRAPASACRGAVLLGFWGVAGVSMLGPPGGSARRGLMPLVFCPEWHIRPTREHAQNGVLAGPQPGRNPICRVPLGIGRISLDLWCQRGYKG